MAWIELLRAQRGRGARALAVNVEPACRDISFIVCAHLPNERHTVVGCVTHLLTCVDTPGSKQVVVAYNGEGDVETERQLAALAARDARLLTLRVEGSSSKADNLAAAVQRARGDVVAIFDADCRPAPESPRRALGVLASGFDVVQGASVVTEGTGPLGALVASEMLHNYFNAKRARALDDVAYFSGSNAYWRRDVLRACGVSSSSLTEDIDLSLRALAAGARIAYDPALRCDEAAPATVLGWWHQRRRWMSGWLHSSVMHGPLLLQHLSGRRRAWWAYLMIGRRIAPAIGFMWLTTHMRQHLRLGLAWILLTIATERCGVVTGRRHCGDARVLSSPWKVVPLVPLYELAKHMATLSVLISPARRFRPTPRANRGATNVQPPPRERRPKPRTISSAFSPIVPEAGRTPSWTAAS